MGNDGLAASLAAAGHLPKLGPKGLARRLIVLLAVKGEAAGLLGIGACPTRDAMVRHRSR